MISILFFFVNTRFCQHIVHEIVVTLNYLVVRAFSHLPYRLLRGNVNRAVYNCGRGGWPSRRAGSLSESLARGRRR